MRRSELSYACLLFAFIAGFCRGAAADEAAMLYHQHCASCHGEDRLGGTGPALLPDNLQRLRQSEAASVIRDGRPATQMQAFGNALSAAEITAMVELIYRPLPALPDWSAAQIEASRMVHNAPDALPARPVHQADPLNLFTVVRNRRSPRHDPRRRQVRAAVALPVALRAARRCQVLARWPLSLSRLARRLG
jgi:hypothetical protein